jgi:signal transduction histidine kinase
MRSVSVRGPAGTRAHPIATTLMIPAGAAVVSCASVWPFWHTDPLMAAVNAVVAVSWVTIGAVLWEDPGQRGNAAALGLAGPFWLMSWWYAWDTGPLPLLGECLGYLWFVVGALALLRYPEPVLAHRFERVFLTALGVWVCAAQLAISLVSLPEWQGYAPTVWWPALLPDRALNDALTTAYYRGTLAAAVVMLLLLGLKLRRSRGIDRVDAVPVIVAAGTCGIIGAIYLVLNLVPHSEEAMHVAQLGVGLAAMAVPVAFLVVVLQHRLVRSAVADLVVGIGIAPTVAQVQEALRAVLHDPTLRLWLWLPAAAGYVDDRGATRDFPPLPDRWEVAVRGHRDEPLAVLLVDPALQRHRRLVDSVVVASGLALENGRLYADLQRQLAEVRASRTRIVEAGLAERRRIERDLHDGVQQSLLAAAATLGVARIQSDGQYAIMEAIDQARSDVRTALGDLRALARGIYPAALSRSGLAAALDAVTERLPLRITLDIPATRWAPSIESAIYLLTCEALTNTVKHAQASTAGVRIRHDGATVRVTVRDDGVGCAAVTGHGGLAGIADRVRAIGGVFELDSPPCGGTTITASIPCG